MIRQLAHICFRTNNFKGMIAFYRDALGLPVKFVMKNQDGAEFGYYFALGNCTFLELFDHEGARRQWGGAAAPPQPARGAHYQHFCVQVEGLEGLCAGLGRKGVQVSEIRTGMDGSRQAWISDPDGNRIELMEYTPQSLQTKP